MQAAGLELEGVSKRFGATLALHDLDLSAAPGELLVLLGPSGCGKSTVLRLIAGLEEPTAGTIRIGGAVMNGIEPRRRDVAMVFQSYALYPHLSVRRNIEFPLRARHVAPAERQRLVHAATASLQLEGLLDRKPAQLSGGQRQRVALARAIVREPKAFLMDEPLSNLDARLRVETRAELIDLHRRSGTTTLYVTHDQVEAMTMGDRIAVLRDGALQQVGTPAEVHDRPENSFVAAFVGSPPMNLVAGTIAARSEGTGGSRLALSASIAGGSVPLDGWLASPAGRALETGRAVLAGIRPEHLAITAAGTVAAEVGLVELLGHEQHVACRIADGGLVIVRVPGVEEVARVGDRLRLAVTGRVHLFDPDSGRRIDGT
ncbi:MAG: ABC transporter ATP-binding protein [Actinomycetota bacterium]|nr:ABC transporter ATP-binding protein [Actinomycetota bacterium]